MGAANSSSTETTVVSWIYCNRTDTDCDTTTGISADQASVSLGMLADYGMAAALFRNRTDVRAALRRVINASRISAGTFRTLSVPIESVSPRLFCAWGEGGQLGSCGSSASNQKSSW